MKTLEPTIQIKERPILFSGAMVKAILEGRKTQTRRIVKNTGLYAIDASIHGEATAARELKNMAANPAMNRYGQPGEKLWVRESIVWSSEHFNYYYAADKKGCGDKAMEVLKNYRSVPSIHMPRSLCRIVLEVTNVRVERLQDINEEDAKAEGVKASESVEMKDGSPCYSLPYQILWDRINGFGAWEKNPFVWVVEFKKL